jgi:hypothetical protein
VVFAIRRQKKKTDFQKLRGGNHILNIEVRTNHEKFDFKIPPMLHINDAAKNTCRQYADDHSRALRSLVEAPL